MFLVFGFFFCFGKARAEREGLGSDLFALIPFQNSFHLSKIIWENADRKVTADEIKEEIQHNKTIE